MAGVEILNQWEVVTKTVFSWNSFWIGFLIGFAVVTVITIFVGICNWDWRCFFAIIGSIGLIVGIIAALFAGFLFFPTPVEWETYYEVTISEEVSMSEFMEKYEILETRGTIFTVREKTD